jgi:hypothetical protein
MTKKEMLIKEVKKLPNETLDEVLDFIRFQQMKMLGEKSATYSASESSLKKDWLKPEEDKAWRDL